MMCPSTARRVACLWPQPSQPLLTHSMHKHERSNNYNEQGLRGGNRHGNDLARTETLARGVEAVALAGAEAGA
eukprot:622912-Lingulodinium_polyedra.AAC.1